MSFAYDVQREEFYFLRDRLCLESLTVSKDSIRRFSRPLNSPHFAIAELER